MTFINFIYPQILSIGSNLVSKTTIAPFKVIRNISEERNRATYVNLIHLSFYLYYYAIIQTLY